MDKKTPCRENSHKSIFSKTEENAYKLKGIFYV
jgi:hypothetical protein